MAKSLPRRIRMTHAALARLPSPADKWVYYFDDKLPGLAVCCWPSGAKVFYLYRKIAGRPVRMKLGRFGDITLEAARREATRLAGRIAGGEDPAQERRQARREMLLSELWPLYLEKHAKPRKRTWQEDQRQWEAYIAPALGSQKLSAIHRHDVAAFHAAIGAAGRNRGRKKKKAAPYQANRVLALLSSLFSFAQTELELELSNPCQGVRHFEEQSRERFLRSEELRALLAALAQEVSPWNDFFLVSLLTGARRENVCSMRWAEIDLERGLWNIPAASAKGVVAILLPLPDAVRAMLQRRAKVDKRGEWVFPARVGMEGHISEPKAAWLRICRRAGLEGVRLHDLRRTFASWAAGAGISMPVIAKALGHATAAVTPVYARVDVEPLRLAVEATTRKMLAAGGPVKSETKGKDHEQTDTTTGA